MNDLIVKNVDFLGDNLVAAQDKQGVIWAGVSYFCRGIGLNKSQKDVQIQLVQNDETLRRGCLKFQAGVFDPNNETIALQLDYIPLWLAKISITPAMKENNPRLVEKLVKYQLKAKDILAAAFLQKGQLPAVSFKEQVECIPIIAKDLHVNEVSKLVMYQKLCESNHVPTNFLPDYVADDSREKKTVTELLKQFQLPLSANKFNQLLVKAGILEERERTSSTSKNEKKKFKALTEKGLQYGENLVSKYNTKETQPYYYVDTFLELYDLATRELEVLA